MVSYLWFFFEFLFYFRLDSFGIVAGIQKYNSTVNITKLEKVFFLIKTIVAFASSKDETTNHWSVTILIYCIN